MWTGAPRGAARVAHKSIVFGSLVAGMWSPDSPPCPALPWQVGLWVVALEYLAGTWAWAVTR